MSTPAYAELERRFARLTHLENAAGMLHWDMSAIMPTGGAEARAEQLAALKVVCHELLNDPALPDLLEEAEDHNHPRSNDTERWEAANPREMRRALVHATAVPADLVEAFSRACSATDMVWREARPANDFARVAPHLEGLLNLVREIAGLKAERLGCGPYDALLDEYEPDGRAARIDPLFDDLAAFLPDFIDDVLAHQTAGPGIVMPEGPFPTGRQKALGEQVMAALGFDFEHGRLDVSAHPFCGGVPDDVRITTRYDEDDFTQSLMGVIHETGHALYERGLPAAWRAQPVGASMGMSIHESQSLLLEMQACRSREFLDFLVPMVQAAFGGTGPAWEIDNIRRLYTRVERSYIRVDADEVTYPAHVILRYRLERALIAGDMEIADLPGAWNDGMEELLGIRPPDDRLGCLQDLHWYDGAWGYFPTYTLGAMTAAQLFDAAKRAHPEIPEAIRIGNFTPLLAWLRENVHEKGRLLSADDLLREATGRPLDPEVFKTHLKTRYLS